MKWISVKDRLPSHDKDVLYYSEEYGTHRGRYVERYGRRYWILAYCYCCYNSFEPCIDRPEDVTHWMTLPVPEKS